MRRVSPALLCVAVALPGCRRWVPVTLKGSTETTVETAAADATVFHITNALVVPFDRSVLWDAKVAEGKDQVLGETTDVTLTIDITAEDGSDVDAELWYRDFDLNMERAGWPEGWSPIREGDVATGPAVTLGRDDLTWLCTDENTRGGADEELGCEQGPWLRVWLPDGASTQSLSVTLSASATLLYNQRSIPDDPKPQPFDLALVEETEDLWAE